MCFNNKFSKRKEKAKKRIWKNINIFNLKEFIGIIIAMSILHENYWKDDSNICTPRISDIMIYS